MLPIVFGLLKLFEVGSTFAPNRLDCGQIFFFDVGNQRTAQLISYLVFSRSADVRHGAFERIGRFDPALGGAGDEEDWQRRLRAAGGRIRYVAAAGVDHRRAGADARIPALSRAAFHRGRASRRYDAY